MNEAMARLLPEAAVTEAILTLEARRVRAMLEADVDQLAELIDDACVYIHGSGACDSKESYLAQLRSGALVYRAIYVSERDVTVHDGCALATFHLAASIAVAGELRDLNSRCSAVWSLDEPRKLLLFQSTPQAVSASQFGRT